MTSIVVANLNATSIFGSWCDDGATMSVTPATWKLTLAGAQQKIFPLSAAPTADPAGTITLSWMDDLKRLREEPSWHGSARHFHRC